MGPPGDRAAHLVCEDDRFLHDRAVFIPLGLPLGPIIPPSNKTYSIPVHNLEKGFPADADRNFRERLGRPTASIAQ